MVNKKILYLVVLNVFIRLWILREHLDPEKSIKNYILVSVRNEVYCYLRSSFSAKRNNTGESLSEIPDKKADIQAGPQQDQRP